MLKLFKTITPDDFVWNDLSKYFGGSFSTIVQIPNEISYYILQLSTSILQKQIQILMVILQCI